MSALPKISIVTVNFNGGEYLERTINSVLNQRYPNLEYIIIDGGSSDHSVDIIRKYSSELHYWISEADGGMYEALQKGLSKTTGELLAWINSDDLYHQNCFFRVAEIFSDYPQIAWLTGVPSAIDEKDNVMIPKFDDYPVWSKFRYYSGDYKWIQQESTFWRRSLWDKAGGKLDTTLKLAGDFKLWLTFFKYEKLYTAPILIGGFRMRRYGQQSIENAESYANEVKRCYRSELSLLRYLRIPINYLDRVLISIPLVKRVYYETGIRKFLSYAPKLEFDSAAQKILIK